MGILADIKQKLLNGQKPLQLINAGYAKSSVYYVLKKIKAAEVGMPGFPGDDEIVELRRRKEIVRLQKEIAQIEADMGNVPARLAALERRFHALCELFETELDHTAYLLMIMIGMDEDEAKKMSDGITRKDHQGQWITIDGQGG